MADNRKELALAVLAMKLIERGLAFVLDGCVLEVLGKEIVPLLATCLDFRDQLLGPRRSPHAAGGDLSIDRTSGTTQCRHGDGRLGPAGRDHGRNHAGCGAASGAWHGRVLRWAWR